MEAEHRRLVRAWSAASVTCLIGLAAATASAQPVKGERVPVTYLVDRSGFKTVERGQPLTFELHRDPDCSEAMDSEVVSVADPDLVAESVSSRTADASSRAPRRSIRLRYVMEPTSSAGRLYLRVTGSGIEPLGTDCQAQAASIQEEQPDTLEALRCDDGDVAKWHQTRAEWDCAGDASGALVCVSVSSGLSGAASPFTATATCPNGTVRTGGGHIGVSEGDTVLSSQADGANGWFCSIAGAAASGSCQATCCAVE